MSKSFDNQSSENAGQDTATNTPRSLTGVTTSSEIQGILRAPLTIPFPTHSRILSEARKLVAERASRVEDLALICSQDPAIVIELLRISNAMSYAGGRTEITTAKAAIVRLGSEVLLETFDKLAERPKFENSEVKKCFETFRSKGKRISIVARLLSEILAKRLSDDSQTAGLLIAVGEMLAVAYFKDEYVKLSEEHMRSSLNYQLQQHHKFDVEIMGLKYLRKQGIPESLLFALDREARAKNPDRAMLRPLCHAAAELVDAFDNNRWEKFAPGKQLPPKSNIRMLQISEAQYLKLYERTAEYLFSERITEERENHAKLKQVVDENKIDAIENSELNEEFEDDLGADINKLIRSTTTSSIDPDNILDTSQAEKKIELSTQALINEDLFDISKEDFSLDSKDYKLRQARKSLETQIVTPPQLRTSGGNAVVSSISNMFNAAKSSEELLADLLDMLVKGGPFKQTAIIVVSKTREHAIVVAARGNNLGNGQRLELNDPLSPLAQCFSKVQSFGNQSNKSSPFGSKAFALAPIDADHDTPVALYADCGNDGSLTFEARRVFRTVVEILNQKLPTIPGGIPVEIE